MARDGRRGVFPRIACAAALSAALGLAGCGGAAPAGDPADWRSQVRELRLAVRGDESDPAIARRWNAYRAYLAEATGLPIRTFEASDYNGVIQALSSGQVDMAQLGGGSYANVDAQIGALAAPILIARQAEGNTGYYSAILVRSDSPFRTLQDLAGKSLGYVDFNSTSGYIYPRFAMRAQGIDPEAHFGRTTVAGGHIQVAMALANGQVDAAVINVSGGTPETGFSTGPHLTLARQGLIDADDFRVIWTAGPMTNSPFVVRADRPQEMIDLLRGALAALPYEDGAIWEEIGQPVGAAMAAVDRRHYLDVIEMRATDIAERRGLDTPGEAR